VRECPKGRQGGEKVLEEREEALPRLVTLKEARALWKGWKIKPKGNLQKGPSKGPDSEERAGERVSKSSRDFSDKPFTEG